MLPLSNVVVLDFSRLLPGPWASQILADSGATIIKIEQPEEGDSSRANPPFFENESVYFHETNRNKKSLCLNLKSPEGKEIIHKLLKSADVVIENFRVGVAEKLGISYQDAIKIKPDLIYCSITGFGRGNPYEKVGAHDLNIQGLVGSLGLHEHPKEPTFLAVDYASAAYACISILIAILHRFRTKQGCFLDISMYDSLFTMQSMLLASDLAKLAGCSGEPKLEVWGDKPRYAIYKTKDQKAVSISLLEKNGWQLFCQEIGKEELFDPEESSENRHSTHGKKGEIYRKAIADFCLSHNRDDIIARMHKLGIAIFPIYTAEEAVSSPLAKWRHMIEFTNGLPHIANPLQKTPLVGKEHKRPPAIGEHNEEILKKIGYSPEEIAEFTHKKVLYERTS